MATEFTMEVDYSLKPNQPKIHQIDFEVLDVLLHSTIDTYLEELSDPLELEEDEDDASDDDFESDSEDFE